MIVSLDKCFSTFLNAKQEYEVWEKNILKHPGYKSKKCLSILSSLRPEKICFNLKLGIVLGVKLNNRFVLFSWSLVYIKCVF